MGMDMRSVPVVGLPLRQYLTNDATLSLEHVLQIASSEFLCITSHFSLKQSYIILSNMEGHLHC